MSTDEQITISGYWLRKTGLDELPQLINVIKGDMKIVGPRALDDKGLCKAQSIHNFLSFRHSVKPGITGLAQIYERKINRKSLILDRYYVSNSTLLLDIKVILMTILINILSKNVVQNFLRIGKPN